jgi:hypothetical protein
MRAQGVSKAGRSALAVFAVASLALSFGWPARADDYVPPDGTIAYVLTTLHWATYQKDPEAECPQGTNMGPREEFKQLFPDLGKV